MTDLSKTRRIPNFSVPAAFALLLLLLAAPLPAEASMDRGLNPSLDEDALSRLEEAFSNFGVVNPMLYRGAQPDPDKLHLLKEAGMVSIISFRTGKKEVEKERQISEELGLKFFHIPWKGRNDVKDGQVDEFLHIITEPANLPAFVHCKRGAERTGVMLGCYRVMYEEWAAEEAHEEMKTYKFRTFWFRHLKRYLFEFEKRLKKEQEKEKDESRSGGDAS